MDSKPILYLVEDDAFLLEMYAAKFVASGFDLRAFPSAVAALEKMRAGERPSVIVSDIIMPVMDGFKFLEIVQQENLAPGATKIVLSNLGEDEDIQKAVKLGVVGYIVKASSTPSEVLARVQNLYEHAHSVAAVMTTSAL
jgi:CheY-like chemotaxis protein